MNQISKTYKAESVELDAGSRTILSVINSESVDRDREIVQPKGLVKSKYEQNPVVLLSHDFRSLPIGTNLWIKSSRENGKDCLIAKTYISDKTQMGRDVFALFQDGCLNAFSIGFNAIEAGPPTPDEIKSKSFYAGADTVYRKWELLEYSPVSIPANPDAIAFAVAKGFDDKILEMMQKSIPLPEKYKLNTHCVDFAKGLIHAKRVNDGIWKWDTETQNELLGNPPNYESYSKWFLAIDPEADPKTKRAYHFPVGCRGEVYLHALSNDESRAATNGYKEIEAAAHSLFALASALKSTAEYDSKVMDIVGKLNADAIIKQAIAKIIK